MASTASILAGLKPTPNSLAHLVLSLQVPQDSARLQLNVLIALQALTALVVIMVK